jgi:hypothetical protein
VKIEPLSEDPTPVAVFAADVKPKEPPELIIDTKRFDSWIKLVRVLAFVRRFEGRTRRSTAEDAPFATDYRYGERTAIRMAQMSLQGPEWSKRVFRRYHVLAFQDADGLYRIKSRIGRSHLPSRTASPLILPRKSDFARLIINDLHISLCHAGTDATLAEFLHRYWMQEARRCVQRANARCHKCRTAKGPAFALPIMPDLPADRVTRRRVFSSKAWASTTWALRSRESVAPRWPKHGLS